MKKNQKFILISSFTLNLLFIIYFTSNYESLKNNKLNRLSEKDVDRLEKFKHLLSEYGTLSLYTYYNKIRRNDEFIKQINNNNRSYYISESTYYKSAFEPQYGFYYSFLMAIKNQEHIAYGDIYYFLHEQDPEKNKRTEQWAYFFLSLKKHFLKNERTNKSDDFFKDIRTPNFYLSEILEQ